MPTEEELKQQEEEKKKADEEAKRKAEEEAKTKPDEKYTELETKLSAMSENLGKVTEFISNFQKSPTKEEDKKDEISEEDFWANPLSHFKKLKEDSKSVISEEVSKAIAPITDAFINVQKENLRKNADFTKYEPEMDSLLAQYPVLKQQPGIMEKLYKMVKGYHAEDIEKELREKITKEIQNKEFSSLESGTTPEEKKEKTKTLTNEEKIVSHKMFPDYTREKAEEVYLKWK